MSSAKWRPFCLGLNVLSRASNGFVRFVGFTLTVWDVTKEDTFIELVCAYSLSGVGRNGFVEGGSFTWQQSSEDPLNSIQDVIT